MDDDSPGYFRVDQNGVVRSWDDRMAQLTGHDSNEVVGQSMELLIPEMYVERHWRGFHSAMARGSTKHDQPALNVPLRHKDGSTTLHPAREIFLRDGFAASAGVLAIIHPACQPGEDNGLPSPYEDALSDAE
jgi:PAS domain S-box-containing protein